MLGKINLILPGMFLANASNWVFVAKPKDDDITWGSHHAVSCSMNASILVFV